MNFDDAVVIEFDDTVDEDLESKILILDDEDDEISWDDLGSPAFHGQLRTQQEHDSLFLGTRGRRMRAILRRAGERSFEEIMRMDILDVAKFGLEFAMASCV